MPVCRVKVFDAFQLQPGGVDLLLQGSQFFVCPEFVGIARETPARVIAHRLVARMIAARRAEIIHQMHDDMRAAALPCELIMVRVKLVAIKAQAKFHYSHSM